MLMALIAGARRQRLQTSQPLGPLRLPSAGPLMSHIATSMRISDGADSASSAASADSKAAFEQLIERHERDVFGYLWRMTGDEQAAYDLSQETFLRAWRHVGTVATYEQPRAWLFRVATRLALNYRRDQCAAIQTLDLGAADVHTLAAPDPAARMAQRDAIEAALLALPKRLRAALILRDVYGYHADEIASMLQVSRPAAKMAVSRAREQFRAQYSHEEAGE